MRSLALLLFGACACCGAAAEDSGALAESPVSPESVPESVPDAATLEQSGAVIGEILIYPENIFDLNDPQEDKALYRLANKLHIKTRENVVRQQLLFSTGDRYSPRLLEESERILRATRYLYDASIRPIAYHDGKVDIAVTTRDVWTLNPGISFGRSGGASTYGFEIEELNILGTGTSLSLSQKSGVDRDSTLLQYRDPHLAGTWAKLALNYSNNSDGSMREVSLERPFYALDSHWATGFGALDDDRIEPLYDRGEIVDEFREQRQSAGAYWGWSRGLENGWTRRWSIGATYDNRQFDTAPGWEETGLVPEDRKLVYPWVGFELLQDDFQKLQNHDQIGRTEDFYLGTRVSAKLGWADTSFGSDRDALMFSGTAGHGIGTSEHSTLLFAGAFGGRLEGGELRNAVLDGAVRYYNKLSEKRLFFTTLEGSVGHNLDLDNQILLGGDNGLRGYPLRYQSGEARALLTIEQRYFTNWYPFRLFRVGGAMFFDMGRTWGTSPVSEPSLGLLKDVGFGLRIGNSRSGLGNIIHIDVAFPLDGDSSISNVQFLVETKQQF